MTTTITSDARAGGAALTRSARQIGFVVAGWLVIAAVWELAARFLTGGIFPGPVAVAEEMIDLLAAGNVFPHFASTLWKIAVGFGIGVSVGAPIGYLMGRYEYWKAFFRDGVTISGSIPTVSYAVMSLILFGLTPLGPILVVAIVSTPYIAVNVAEGTENVDASLRRMSRAYGRSEADIRRHVDFPSIAPYLFAGVRVSFAVAWKVAALTEVFGGSGGVGYQIKHEYQSFSIAGLLAWMFFFVIFMLALERLLAYIEGRVLRWRPQERTGVLA
ncbi:ABC transporter permease [Mycobacterium sp. 236(2023)]|uniref:ABC transporter permease n=1 Tax=Mycobacterium sp. 236(2023) TaxID=3038163 RepID=UPI0024154C42|nr:ABC transporter permease [Mycobacterium sp. 236(2023)]MDG4667119.1 ABC transporter permease [Mycobacterium sp. 236(2023)]